MSDPGYVKLVSEKFHVIRLRETEAGFVPCPEHPPESLQEIKVGRWAGNKYCPVCRLYFEVVKQD